MSKDSSAGVASTIGFYTPSEEIDAINKTIKAPSASTKGLSKEEERETLGDPPVMTSPSGDIYCKTCRYRYPDPYGYRNGNCGKYKKESGKPNDILFKGAKCAYYRIDRSEQNNKEESK